ncbi:type II secretion system protein [Tumebacillus permanentifrigoris]|uniref:Prepilin-type N-terminal cleavage/methylation domain-containing protein n=1 Tax=Tumebacillus permanentifrigoris TaxID=378543 RepID=A0A316D848_9BACL|nr:prepilin-type N-terminal cleavage/methylation domain-containing protein [Tumebacillus permanentifrigoris]PWK06250.1 prepilin-type N-terminal cleavage/methylation domain-containing protein [Tumebacillus permanentifrigoris]
MALLRKLVNKLKEERGVTLIELLAVIVILGIIAAIGIPSILNSRQDAEKSTGNANAQTLSEVAHRLVISGEKYVATKSEDKDDVQFDFKEVLTKSGLTVDDTKLNESTFSYAADGGTYTLDPTEGTVTYKHDDGDAAKAESTDTTTDGSDDTGGADDSGDEQ